MVIKPGRKNGWSKEAEMWNVLFAIFIFERPCKVSPLEMSPGQCDGIKQQNVSCKNIYFN